MKTRINKYYDETPSFAPRRTAKNNELYEEIKKSEIENFDIGSNAKVIGNNEAQIDINKLKDILEKNYQEVPKRRSLKLDIPEEEEIEMEKTKEYDINAILEKAREEKEVDYQRERLKKVRDTQYDILKNLEVEQEEPKSKAADERTKEELLDLIQTINLNETQNKTIKALAEEEKEEEIELDEDTDTELDPLDILNDLRGDENTVVAGAKEFENELKEAQEKKEKEEIAEALDEDVDDSFYTSSMSFNKNDFADFSDLEESKASRILINILIVIVFLAIIAGIVIFLNDFLNLGWF